MLCNFNKKEESLFNLRFFFFIQSYYYPPKRIPLPGPPWSP